MRHEAAVFGAVGLGLEMLVVLSLYTFSVTQSAELTGGLL